MSWTKIVEHARAGVQGSTQGKKQAHEIREAHAGDISRREDFVNNIETVSLSLSLQ